MNIALFPKIHNETSQRLTKHVYEFLKTHAQSVCIEDNYANIFNAPPLSTIDPSLINILITMGGDGSILRVAHHYSHFNAAILGINLGHLGFMADVKIADIDKHLTNLINNRFTIEKRMILEGTSNTDQSILAINDCVLHRSTNPNLIQITVSIEERLINIFEADGIIVSTPNGSTAYSLAAGGPIISPDLDVLVITPICPHTISNRPIVLATNQTIRIEYSKGLHDRPIQCVSDGLNHFNMSINDYIHIKKSNHTFKLVNLDNIDYFSTLRDKLGWSGTLR